MTDPSTDLCEHGLKICPPCWARTTVANVEVQDYGGDTVSVRLCYPRNSRVQRLEVDLSDIRAADGLRITYDFARDGWVIEQASTWEWDADDPVIDMDWQEVAFVQAWAREKEK